LLDGNLDSALDISDSKVWFGLYHPKVSTIALLLNVVYINLCVLCTIMINFDMLQADVRRATLLDLDYSVIPETKAGSKVYLLF